MLELIIHTVPGSPFARATIAGLKEKRLPYRLAPLRLGDHKSAEHLKRHPFGRMPVIEHGAFTLYETQAILRYLDRLAPEPRFVPEGAEDEARMNQLIGISDWYVFNHISAPITFQRFVAPKFGLPVDEKRIAEAIEPARACIGALEAILGDKEFLAAATLSIADIMIAAQLDLFARIDEGREMLAGAPRLISWLARLLARRSFAETSWEHFGAI
ncbi:MAG: glutathione S-transferase family protein, partial [Parvularculaceae bacterium]